MSITAATSSVNRIVRSGPGRSLFESGKSVSGTGSWFQGDLMCFDASSHTVRVVAATGDALTFVGIADNQVASGNLAGPYDGLTAVDAAQAGVEFVGPKFGVSADIKLKAGDAFAMGVKVYLVDGGDTQTVTSSDPGDGNYIGIFVDMNGAVATAASGQLGRCLIGCRYPSATGTGLVF